MADADNPLMLSLLKEIRADVTQQRTPLLQLVELGRRHERRFADMDRPFAALEQRVNDLVPELELILKGELMGRLANFETRIDARIDELAVRISGKTEPAK